MRAVVARTRRHNYARLLRARARALFALLAAAFLPILRAGKVSAQMYAACLWHNNRASERVGKRSGESAAAVTTHTVARRIEPAQVRLSRARVQVIQRPRASAQLRPSAAHVCGSRWTGQHKG